jgi:heme-degrading monooxygenase HmoA
MPLVTVTVLHYRPAARFRAFANMGRVLMQPIQAEGLQFGKLMGSGHNFGLIPNLSTYVFLGVWDSEQQAETFLTSSAFAPFTHGTDQVRTLYLEPYHAHGLWDGVNPFSVNSQQRSVNSEQLTVKSEQRVKAADRCSLIADNCSLIAVLTRATIRPGALFDFWRHVPATRKRLLDHKDNLLFGIGVGEKLVTQQCTISVWRNRAAVEQFAYRQSGHREVVRRTRERRWYSEELFARFRVLRAVGFTFGV